MDNTLEYYNKSAKEYADNTREASMSELTESFLKYLPAKAAILDLGCGSGRDSKIFIKKCHEVTAVDGSIELCKIASEYIGQKVICSKFDEINYKNAFDGVWACASILHAPLKDLGLILEKIEKALKAGGYLFTCFKYGDFEGDRDGRYFTDLTEKKLKDVFSGIKGLKLVETFITVDVRPERDNEKWINFIAIKEIKV